MWRRTDFLDMLGIAPIAPGPMSGFACDRCRAAMSSALAAAQSLMATCE